jgi:hypothetical protein
MPAVAKRKVAVKPTAPALTLEERAKALVAAAEQIDLEADALLDALAEKYRPGGEGAAIPAPWLRQNWASRARDENWRTVKVALQQIGA